MDALTLIAEVAVGLAGFAGVAVMLGRGPGRWQGGDALRIQILLGAAFIALFGSLFVIGLITTGVGESPSLRAGAALLAVCIASWTVLAVRGRGRLDPESSAVFSERIARVIGTLTVAAFGAQLVVALGFAGRAEFGLFYAGLFFALLYAAFAFVRLMFVRPASE
jgi:hypothetical protein